MVRELSGKSKKEKKLYFKAHKIMENFLTIVKFVLYFLLVLGVLYFIGGLISLKWNIANWEATYRILLVFWSFVISLILSWLFD